MDVISVHENNPFTKNDNCSFLSANFTSTHLSTTAKIINSVISPVLLLLGIPGNMITMAVILKQRRTMTSTAVYLLILAIADTMFLIFGTFADWLDVISGFKLRDTNSAICKLVALTYFSSTQISSWVLVAITIERIISLARPHQYRQICTRISSTIVGLVICTSIVLINIHVLYGYGISKTIIESRVYKCGPLDHLEEYVTFVFDIWHWVDFTILFAIPFIVLIFGNSYVLVRILKMSAIGKGNATEVINRKRRRSITILIFCLNAVFFICVSPFSVFVIVGQYTDTWIYEIMCIDPVEHEFRRGVIEVIGSSFLCLSYINPTVNFILYVLSGAEFRKAVKTLFSCKHTTTENAFK